MHVQDLALVFDVDEAIHHAVAVTGEVRQGASFGWLLLQAMQRNDREELVDGPDVGRRLKHREIAIIDAGEGALEVEELFWRALEAPHGDTDFFAAMPV